MSEWSENALLSEQAEPLSLLNELPSAYWTKGMKWFSWVEIRRPSIYSEPRSPKTLGTLSSMLRRSTLTGCEPRVQN